VALNPLGVFLTVTTVNALEQHANHSFRLVPIALMVIYVQVTVVKMENAQPSTIKSNHHTLGIHVKITQIVRRTSVLKESARVELWDTSATTPSHATLDFIATRTTTHVPKPLEWDSSAQTIMNAHLEPNVVCFLAATWGPVTPSSVGLSIRPVLILVNPTNALLDLSVGMEPVPSQPHPRNPVNKNQIVFFGEDLKPVVCAITIPE